MTRNIVLMPGLTPVDVSLLRLAAADFGWRVHIAHSLEEVTSAQAYRSAAALLFCRDALGAEFSWVEVIARLRHTVPDVRLVACHKFSESLDWPELSNAGAFHALGLPMKENEVRQSLGFLWEAENRLARAAGMSHGRMAAAGMGASHRAVA